MIRECVEYLGAGEDVETDQHNVVGEEHECGEPVGDLRLSEDVVAEVADVMDQRVLHDV